jgi:membrane protease YdiL (CAAX protease family)
MSTIKTFIQRHPVLTYFILTFALSWGGMLLVIGGRGAIPGTSEQTDPFVYLAMLPGPSIAGILLTGLVYGRAGFRTLLSHFLSWRVGARWYAVALLAAPLVASTTLFLLLPTSPVFLPGIFASNDKASLLLSSIVAGLVVGIFEEIGWTGFAVPGLRRRYSVLSTGLIVGLLWGVWHLLLFFWTSGGFSGTLSLALFLPAVLFCEGVAPVFRVLMVWVYDRTGSLLVAILMHASNTGGVMMILMPLAIGLPLMIWYLVLVATLWIVVAAVHRQQALTRQARRALPG